MPYAAQCRLMSPATMSTLANPRYTPSTATVTHATLVITRGYTRIRANSGEIRYHPSGFEDTIGQRWTFASKKTLKLLRCCCSTLVL